MNQIKKLLAWLAWTLGALSLFRELANRYQVKNKIEAKVDFPFIKSRCSRAVQILVYHRVNDDGDPFFPALTVAEFKKQMEFIAEEYHPYSLDDAIESIEADNIPDNAIVVTFDDGYRDNFQNAFPILRELPIPAVIFLATDAIGSDKCLWHDVVFTAFRTTQASTLRDFPHRGSVYSLRNTSDKVTAQRAALEFLWSVSEDERAEGIDRLVESLEVQHCEKQRLMLSWDEVGIMYEHGISFGSHTVTHPILTGLSGARLRSEIVESKSLIEGRLNCNVRCFAYPIGRAQDFDQRAKAILKENGYRCAVTTMSGVNDSQRDLFELRRGTPWERDLPSFAMKLAWYKFAQSQ